MCVHNGRGTHELRPPVRICSATTGRTRSGAKARQIGTFQRGNRTLGKELQPRIAANESAFRDVNEAIARGQWPGEQDHPARFRCECARFGCNELIELTPREYEAVRANPRHFVVQPRHKLPEAEVIVSRKPGYLVVEKIDAAGRTAEEADERTD